MTTYRVGQHARWPLRRSICGSQLSRYRPRGPSANGQPTNGLNPDFGFLNLPDRNTREVQLGVRAWSDERMAAASVIKTCDSE